MGTNTNTNDEIIPTFFLFQEVFDALPIRSFQKAEDGTWRERMVDIVTSRDEKDTQSDGSNDHNIRQQQEQQQQKQQQKENDLKPRFQFVLSPGPTPALRSLLRIDKDGLPEERKRNKNKQEQQLQQQEEPQDKEPLEIEEKEEEIIAINAQADALNNAPIGTVVEVCPEAIMLARDLATMLGGGNENASANRENGDNMNSGIDNSGGGAALIIDYGSGEGSADTLRAFGKHKQGHPLSKPGKVDVTADVDFAALVGALNNTKNTSVTTTKNVKAFGPVTQGRFLASMGAVERTLSLMEDEMTTDDQAETLCDALERLVSHDSGMMGERYKVVSIVSEEGGNAAGRQRRQQQSKKKEGWDVFRRDDGIPAGF